MDDHTILTAPSAIEKYVMCLEEQVTKLTDALSQTIIEIDELKGHLKDNLAVKPYHDYRLQGSNLTEWYFVRIVSLYELNKDCIIDYFKTHNMREFSMVTSKYMEDRHSVEMIGVFRDYVYLSNYFNHFYDEFKKVNEKPFLLTVISIDRCADYMCTRFDIHKKQLVMEKLPAPLMYKLNNENNLVELTEVVPFGRPDEYFERSRIETPVMQYTG
jgi:hypothetical protein